MKDVVMGDAGTGEDLTQVSVGGGTASVGSGMRSETAVSSSVAIGSVVGSGVSSTFAHGCQIANTTNASSSNPVTPHTQMGTLVVGFTGSVGGASLSIWDVGSGGCPATVGQLTVGLLS